MKRLLLLLCVVAGGVNAVAAPIHTKEVLSKVYTIARKYRSMEGPSSIQRFTFSDSSTPELLWIIGVRTEMVGADGTTPQLPELMCHVNVDLDPVEHQAVFDFRRVTASRLMTLSQGMLEAKLPPGFGFPVASNEPLVLFTQVLNHNIEHPVNLQVRHRVTFEYLRDSELTEPIAPLFNVGASGMVQLDDNPNALASMPSMVDAMPEHSGASCIVAPRAPQAFAASADYTDPTGRRMTGHWIVPPGRQVNASDITWFMQLQYDTRIHYAAFHLHPFAESLSIRDTTSGATIVKSLAKNPATGVGLTHVDTFSSIAGLPLYKTHKYDLISVYNNTTAANADSMASVFLGLDDPEFVHLPPAEFAKRAAAIIDSNSIVVHTPAGDLKAQLMRDTEPVTSAQVARLLYGGVFDRATATNSRSEVRITVPMTEQIRRLLQPVAEHGGGLDQGVVAYCPPSGAANEVSLRFIADSGAAHDARCIAFAHLTEGMDLVTSISKSPVAVSASVKGTALLR